MENYKKVQVVMLATEKESRLHYNEQRKIIITTNSDMKHPMDKPQHLYFLSNEEIKEGDWLLDLRSNKIAKNINNYIKSFNSSIKKIIATTNPELIINYKEEKSCGFSGDFNLPRPSNSFIQKYIEEYNKGNILTEVIVEYEELKSYSGNNGLSIKQILKVAPDNTITIKVVVEGWDDIFKKANFLNMGVIELSNWLEENYEAPIKKQK